MIVFVFGSNLAGVHGAGAARDAARFWGALPDIGQGMVGESYAIPTKGYDVRSTLPLSTVEHYISKFILFAESRPDWDFQVTRIGCGYAGYTDDQIAPLFAGAPENCHLPLGWRQLVSR